MLKGNILFLPLILFIVLIFLIYFSFSKGYGKSISFTLLTILTLLLVSMIVVIYKTPKTKALFNKTSWLPINIVLKDPSIENYIIKEQTIKNNQTLYGYLLQPLEQLTIKLVYKLLNGDDATQTSSLTFTHITDPYFYPTLGGIQTSDSIIDLQIFNDNGVNTILYTLDTKNRIVKLIDVAENFISIQCYVGQQIFLINANKIQGVILLNRNINSLFILSVDKISISHNLKSKKLKVENLFGSGMLEYFDRYNFIATIKSGDESYSNFSFVQNNISQLNKNSNITIDCFAMQGLQIKSNNKISETRWITNSDLELNNLIQIN